LDKRYQHSLDALLERIDYSGHMAKLTFSIDGRPLEWLVERWKVESIKYHVGNYVHLHFECLIELSWTPLEGEAGYDS
jgi:hypothetical protein